MIQQCTMLEPGGVLAVSSLTMRIEAVWQALSSQYNWRLSDFGSIVDRAVDHFARATEVSNFQIRAVLTGYYSERLYQGLQRREERAAEELLVMCCYQACRLGLPQVLQEDITYETVNRVIERLDHVHQPRALIAFALVILRRLAQSAMIRHETVEADLPPEMFRAFEDPILPIEAVEQKLISEQLLALLQKKLPNKLQRLVVIRTIMLGEKPINIARDLGVPGSQITLAKSRGLKRLREDARFMEFCHSLQNTS